MISAIIPYPLFTQGYSLLKAKDYRLKVCTVDGFRGRGGVVEVSALKVLLIKHCNLLPITSQYPAAITEDRKSVV